MNIRRIRAQDGFTLAEVLVATTILFIVSAMMLSFFIQGSNLWQLITNESDLRSLARNAINYMTQELQKTTRTSSEIPSPNLFIPSKPNNHSIDFYLPTDIDGNGSIINNIGVTEWDKSNKIQYKYTPALRQLYRLEKGNRHIIANDVALIEFEDSSINPTLYNNELKLILILERLTSQNRTISVTLTSIVKLRNQ